MMTPSRRRVLWITSATAGLIAVPLLLAAAPVRVRPNPFSLVTDDARITVRIGSRMHAQYRYAAMPFKPYVEQLTTPAGVPILRDAPHDHLHHHALMFAVTVDGVNFWEERDAPGQQIHRGFDDVVVTTRDKWRVAGFTERLDWVNPRSGELLLHEHRTIETYARDDLRATLLTWQSRLAPPSGKTSAELTGSTYFGLGMRFVPSMDTGGTFINAAGGTGVEGTNDAPARWCAYTAEADGQPVTVALFDHPDNPRHPAVWFTMTEPFAYLAGTLDLAQRAIRVEADHPFVLRYGVGLWDGRVGPERIESLYRRWISCPAGPVGDPDVPPQ